MGKLMTAKSTQVHSDAGEADQNHTVTSDVSLYAIDQPPFITVPPVNCTELNALSPPDRLVSDWNRLIPENSIMETWEKTNYEERYRNFIEDDFMAQKQIDIIEGELEENDVCIISGSSLYPLCPRRILYEIITGKEIYHG